MSAPWKLAFVCLVLLACEPPAVREGPSTRETPSLRAAPAHPPCLTPLAEGAMLVARPSLGDTNFAKTVVLIMRYDRSGAIGLVLNKPVSLDLARLLPDSTVPEDHGIPVHYGGPVLPMGLVFLASVPAPEGADGREVIEGVHVVRVPSLAELLESGDVKLRAYAGHAGWAPGQLDAERARGDWCVLPADAPSVFSGASGADLWERLIEGLAPRPRA